MQAQRLTLLVLLAASKVCGHGTLVWPRAYQTGEYVVEDDESCEGLSCYFMTNYTFVVGSPTISQSSTMRTWQDWGYGIDVTASHPWRAPGTAGVLGTGCGIFGGNPRGCDGVPAVQGLPNQCTGAGSALGVDAALLESQATTTTWSAGSVVEVKFGLAANHGGGYSYRLCKKPADGLLWQTEECFSKGVLPFEDKMQAVEFSNGTRIEWLADGVIGPVDGATWRRNPIPAYGGVGGNDPSLGTQFPPKHPASPVGFGPFNDFVVVDSLRLPKDIEPGRYALSWRWDSEQTSQVWLACAAIDIVSSPTVQNNLTLGRRCGSTHGACGLDCANRSDPTTCVAFAASSFLTVQRNVCEDIDQLSQDDDDDDATNFTWFDEPDRYGICAAESLCGLDCNDAGTCTLFFNNLNEYGKTAYVCSLINGTWLSAATTHSAMTHHSAKDNAFHLPGSNRIHNLHRHAEAAIRAIQAARLRHRADLARPSLSA